MESNVMPAMNFSQRMGIIELRIPVQIDSLDEDLRARLWNALYIHFLVKFSWGEWPVKKTSPIVITIWTEFFKHTVDELPTHGSGHGAYIQSRVKKWLFEAEYNRVFDLIEYMIPFIEQHQPKGLDGFITDCNKALEKEGSIYRIVNRMVVRTIRAVEYNVDEQTGKPETEANAGSACFADAVELMADRNNPHFNEAIAEAIKSVEWTLENYPVLTTPDNALSPLTVYHQHIIPLKQALTEPGTAATFEEAQYWLIVSATLINYLKRAAG